MKIARYILTLLFLVSLLTTLAGPSHAQFILYDNFAGGIIDPDRWQGHSTEGSFGAPTTEFIRIVENSALRLALTSWGDTTSNTSSPLTRHGVQFKQLGTLGGPGSIIGVKYKLTITNAAVEDCAANAAGGLARAQFLGWFFNDTQSTPSSDDTGNIIAGINVTKLSDGSNRIEPVFVRCMNAGCTSTTTPAGVTLPTFASTWSLNTPLIIKVVWNQALGKFNLKVTDQATQAFETQVINYNGIVTDAGIPTNFDFKVFRVQNGVENCTSGRKQAMIDALFDNVNVSRAP